MEPLLSEMPMIGVGGNHEVETGEAWVQMNLRYPQPWRSSGSVSPLWYSYETGPAHIVGLNSYARFDQESLQYKWLEEDLKQVDRGRTPWLILMWHTPWYNSNVSDILTLTLVHTFLSLSLSLTLTQFCLTRT